MTRNQWSPLAFLAATLISPASAQLLSNASLTGAYNFRYLGAVTAPSRSARSFLGTLTFDGNGGFTVTGQGTAASGALNTLKSGTYYVGSGGIFYMTNPVDTSGDTALFGGFANGAIVASSTDSAYGDMFVAVPAATAGANSTLNGLYRVAHLEFPSGNFAQTRNTFFPMTADGAGSFGNATISGFAQNLNDAPTTQTSTGVTYSVTANGTGTLNIPAPAGGLTPANILLSGSKTLYVSPDGSLFIAGSASGYDLVIGIKAYSGNSPTSAFAGLYFTNFFENLDGDLYSGDGSSNLLGSSQFELAHLRTFDEAFGGSYDSTYGAGFNLNADGTVTYTDTGSYALGAGGNFLVGSGDGINYQLTLYAKGQTVGGNGVFLNPQAIVNNATNIPFTAQVAPGEFLDLYGSGLAAGTSTASLPYSTSLGGVQVTVNDTPAPVYYASPNRIIIITPYSVDVPGTLLNIQVNNAGTKSNVAQVWAGVTSPGPFTLPPGGVGTGAIRHNADGSVVSSANPAKAGEAVQIYVSGLGQVAPAVADGTGAPSAEPLARVVNELDGVFIGNSGVAAQVVYAGLAPGFAGLYQVSVIIPNGLDAGDNFLNIQTVDATNFQTTIAIGK